MISSSALLCAHHLKRRASSEIWRSLLWRWSQLSRLAALSAAAITVFGGLQSKAAQQPGAACIWALGDSLTGGYQAELAKILPDRRVIGGGLAAQNSTQIAARTGAVLTRVSVADDSIPASGNVRVTAIAPPLISSAAKTGEIEGSLAGRAGKLTWDAGDSYFFTPTPDENSTPAPPHSVFTPNTSEARDCVLILWAGHNSIPAVARILADADAILAPYLRRHGHFLVIGLLNGEQEMIGAAGFRLKMQVSETLAQRYGPNYIDIRRYLIERGLQDLNLVADSADQENIANGVVPHRLRQDVIHLNDDGNRLVARYLAAAIKDRQW